MSCQARNSESCDDEDIDLYVQEALDAIEYAVGPATSKWGAERAKNGHPEPFKLKYVEIGNENHGPDYAERYKKFYNAIKEKYPDIITIADTADGMGDLPIEIVDEHYYRGVDALFGMANYYDNYDFFNLECLRSDNADQTHRFQDGDADGNGISGKTEFYEFITSRTVGGYDMCANRGTFIIISAGNDGLYGTKDDITNFDN